MIWHGPWPTGWRLYALLALYAATIAVPIGILIGQSGWMP